MQNSNSHRLAIFVATCLCLTGCIGPSIDEPDEDIVESDPAEEPESTVFSALAELPQFSTFTAALATSGLGEVLEGTGPFTILAPTDDAFETLNIDLSALNPDQMADLLQYHLIAGEMSGNAAQNTSWSNTLQQERIHLAYVEGDVIIDGLATMTDFDRVADNGLIHVLDGVLLPASLYSHIDLIQIVRSYPRFSKFRELMEGAGQIALELGSQNANITLFASANRGFNEADIDPAELQSGELVALAHRHAVDALLDSAALEELEDFTTRSGETLSVSTDGDLLLNEKSALIYADIEVNNGIFHVISRPIPPTPAN